MRKHFLAACAAALALISASHAEAQSARSALTTLNTTSIATCPPNVSKCITPPLVENVFQQIINSTALLSDHNVYTGINDFSGGSVVLPSGVVAAAIGFTPLNPANNLSDVTNAASARNHLGLGTLATLTSVGAAQLASGAAAANLGFTPLNPANNLGDVSSVSGARSALGVSATGADTTYANRANNLSDLANTTTARSNLGLGALATLSTVTASQMASGAAVTNIGFTPLAPLNNLSDIASAATARTNLGLGSVATLPAASVAQTSNNLSDLTNLATARTNLGLAGAALLNVGTTSGTVAAGNDSRFPASPPNLIANNLSDVANAFTARTNLGVTFANLPDKADPTAQINWASFKGTLHAYTYGAALGASAATNTAAINSALAAAKTYQLVNTSLTGSRIAVDLDGMALKVGPGILFPTATSGAGVNSGLCLINGTLIADPTVGIGSGAGQWAADGSTPIISLPTNANGDCIVDITFDGGVTGTSPTRTTVASFIDNKSGQVLMHHLIGTHVGAYAIYNETGGGGNVVSLVVVSQWIPADGEFTTLSNYTSKGLWENSHDDWAIRTEFHWMGWPFYLDTSTNTFTAVHNHPFSGGDGLFLPAASKLIYLAAGANAAFIDNYFDNGEIDLYSENIVFRNNRYLYSSAANANSYFIGVYANGLATPYQLDASGWYGTNNVAGAAFISFINYGANTWPSQYASVVNVVPGQASAGFDMTGHGSVIMMTGPGGLANPTLTLQAVQGGTLGAILAFNDNGTTTGKLDYVRSAGNTLVLGAFSTDMVDIQKGDATTKPTLSFDAANTTGWSLGGTSPNETWNFLQHGAVAWVIGTNFYASGNAKAPQMLGSNASATNATLAPDRADNAAGLGADQNGDLSLIADVIANTGPNTTGATAPFEIARVSGQSGNLQLTPGLVTSPALAFIGDVTTGIYNPASPNHEIGVVSAGVEFWRFKNDGGLISTGVTGGDQGAGTINAAGLYVNGVSVAAGSSATLAGDVTGTVGASTVVKENGHAFPTSAVANDVATMNSTTGMYKDSGTLLSSLAPLASPALTGTPVAPTAAVNTNTTQIATTAYVKAATTLSSLTTVGTIVSGGLGTGATIGGVTMALGSDAVGDIYYAGASEVLTRLADVATGSCLTSGGVGAAPAWASCPSLSSPNAWSADQTMAALIGSTANSYKLINAAASATQPTLVPYSGDLKAGIGADASGDVSIITDNAGAASETLRVLASASTWIIGTNFYLNSAAGGEMRGVATTATVAAFVPIKTDTKAGIGADTAGDVSVIANNGGTATEMLRVTGTLIQVKVAGTFALTESTPDDNATCAAGTIYADASYVYVCTASGTVKRAALSTY